VTDTVNVTILDTQTGKRVTTSALLGWADCDEYYWANGNGSCDCNREIIVKGIDNSSDSSACLGCHRYLIVAVEGDHTLTLRELNEDYPEELLNKHFAEEA